MLFGLYFGVINLQNKVKMTIPCTTLQITIFLKTNITYKIHNKSKDTKQIFTPITFPEILGRF